jgi:hypothetical protein
MERIRIQPQVLKPQATRAFRLASRPSNRALSLTRPGEEIASRAEYAGSIPVIGSNSTRVDSVLVVEHSFVLPDLYPDTNGSA